MKRGNGKCAGCSRPSWCRSASVLAGLPLDARDNLWGIAAAYYIAWNIRFSADLEFSGHYASYGKLVRAIDSHLESKKRRESRSLEKVEKKKVRRWLD